MFDLACENWLFWFKALATTPQFPSPTAGKAVSTLYRQWRRPEMKVAFQKWGNSLALRVPKAFADEIGASDGKAAEMTVSNGKLVIEIARSPRRKRRYILDKLVAGITPDNRHEEIDWGPPVGNEVW